MYKIFVFCFKINVYIVKYWFHWILTKQMKPHLQLLQRSEKFLGGWASNLTIQPINYSKTEAVWSARAIGPPKIEIPLLIIRFIGSKNLNI